MLANIWNSLHVASILANSNIETFHSKSRKVNLCFRIFKYGWKIKQRNDDSVLKMGSN
jgi:hypothetical protein